MGDVLAALLDGDGKVKRWPKRPEERAAVLAFIVAKFEQGKDYAEKDVNAIISASHSFNDSSMLRRELITAKLMNRTPDCKRYWVDRQI
jgi:hypothetical protein